MTTARAAERLAARGKAPDRDLATSRSLPDGVAAVLIPRGQSEARCAGLTFRLPPEKLSTESSERSS